jgi:predicted phosphodiesterase
LDNTAFISGNADRFLVKPTLPLPTEIPNDKLDWLIQVTRDQYWTIGVLSQGRWLDWLASLPLEQRFDLPSGVCSLLVHSYPGSDESPGLNPAQPDDVVRGLFGSVDETLIFVGHTHTVQDRRIDDKRIINPGCIGKPVGLDTRATYAIVNADEMTYDVCQYYVEYDTEAVIQQLYDLGYPGADFMTQFYRGEYIPEWQRSE